MPNRLLSFVRLALVVAERVLPLYAHKFAPRRYTQPQLLGCLLIKEYLNLDYRSVEEVLDASESLRSVLGLNCTPDHSTLWRFARHRLTPELIEQALAETVRLLSPGSVADDRGRTEHPMRCVALDSTGLWTTHASRYFEARRGDTPRKQRSWMKWAAALWVEPQMIVAQRVRRGPCGDFSDLIPLADSAARIQEFDVLLADAGYDSEANHRHCREHLQVESLIPAKKRRCVTVIARTPYRSLMVQVLGSPGDPCRRRIYGQRWKVETLVSVIKRKWGEALSARCERTQAIQALLHGLVYNLYRLATIIPLADSYLNTLRCGRPDDQVVRI